MAMAHYEGVAGVARKVAKRYEGISGVARNVTKAYTGVSGVARQYFGSNNVTVSAVFTPSSTVDGTPSYSYEIDGNNLTIQMTSARTTKSNYDTDRNQYIIYIKGIKAGDHVEFTFVDSTPLASQAIDIYYGSSTIKAWSSHGTQDFAFDATETADMTILLTDGDFNQRTNTMTCEVQNFKINSEDIVFYES